MSSKLQEVKKCILEYLSEQEQQPCSFRYSPHPDAMDEHRKIAKFIHDRVERSNYSDNVPKALRELVAEGKITRTRTKVPLYAIVENVDIIDKYVDQSLEAIDDMCGVKTADDETGVLGLFVDAINSVEEECPDAVFPVRLTVNYDSATGQRTSEEEEVKDMTEMTYNEMVTYVGNMVLSDYTAKCEQMIEEEKATILADVERKVNDLKTWYESRLETDLNNVSNKYEVKIFELNEQIACLTQDRMVQESTIESAQQHCKELNDKNKILTSQEADYVARILALEHSLSHYSDVMNQQDVEIASLKEQNSKLKSQSAEIELKKQLSRFTSTQDRSLEHLRSKFRNIDIDRVVSVGGNGSSK